MVSGASYHHTSIHVHVHTQNVYQKLNVYCLTTSKIITIGLFTKASRSTGMGSICSENIGEAGD